MSVLLIIDDEPGEVSELQEILGSYDFVTAVSGGAARGVGLFELMVNAIEHGNLGITYEDKSRLLEAGTLRTEIDRRLELPKNQHKRVTVEVKRQGRDLHLVSRDCGPGFDYHKYLTADPKRLFDAHGRGILVAGNALDIEYIDPGNEVCVVLPLGI